MDRDQNGFEVNGYSFKGSRLCHFYFDFLLNASLLFKNRAVLNGIRQFNVTVANCEFTMNSRSYQRTIMKMC